MMKILIIDTPSSLSDRADPPRAFLPLGPVSMASALEQAGHDVEIYDPKIGAALIRKGDHYYFGDEPESISRKIRERKPDMVGISNLFSRDAGNALMIADQVKKVDENIFTAVGGFHASARPHDFMGSGFVDAVAVGEGEVTARELMGALESGAPPAGIRGIITGENVVPERSGPGPFIEDLDSLPLPAYHLVEMERYFHLQKRGYGARPYGRGRRKVSLLTSRGCPFRCVFCSIQTVMGRRWRAHSIEYVLNHIRFLARRYSADFIQFEDDNISWDADRFLGILDGIAGAGMKVRWGTPNGLRVDTIAAREMMLRIKKSGCDYLNIGVESGDQEILDRVIKKRLDLSTVETAARLAAELDIQLSAYYMVGFPGERMENVKRTLDFALTQYRKHHLIPYVNYAMPLPGSELHDIAIEKGCLTEEVSHESILKTAHFGGSSIMRTEDFTPGDLRDEVVRFHGKLRWEIVKKALGSPRILFHYMRFALKNLSIARRIFLTRKMTQRGKSVELMKKIFSTTEITEVTERE